MQCSHLGQIRPVEPNTPEGCESVSRSRPGGSTCGSASPAAMWAAATPNKHATKHFHRTQHPIVRSYERGEDWGWCYVDRLMFEPAPQPG